jgi:hypothetical protein
MNPDWTDDQIAEEVALIKGETPPVLQLPTAAPFDPQQGGTGDVPADGVAAE